MQTKKVFFTNQQKETLSGVLHLPHKETTKAVIVCHGFGSTKDALWIPKLCDTLAKQSYAALRFDFSGNGASEGSFSDADCEKEQQDLASALAFLKKQGYHSFATIGHSMGGTVVLMHAPTARPVKAVIAIAAAIHTKKVEGRLLTDNQKKELRQHGKVTITIHDKPHTLTTAFFTAFEQQNVLKSMAAISAPLLLIHGSDDHTIPLEESTAAQKAVPHLKLTVIEGGSHTLMRGNSADLLIEKIHQWLNEHF